MSIIIRKMDKSDRIIWADMRLRLWDSHSQDEHLSEIDKLLISNNNVSYIAFMDENLPVGFAEVSMREYANGCTGQPVPFLEGIWVNSTHRRKGIGQALVNKISSELINKGFYELCSDAEIRNKQSHQAHENWGFDETERVICYRKKLI
ncbi:GNAT family N-acetyltransferase [Xenorhabdus hominickii]|uniref:Aminoglycoside N(6')-acetyltransferase type 1 n=1 Tax=Xenorhabdus hominickii TaxID=351679 RepID=A0A2G0Q7W1_XENHO|nr:GNAT family N-acetyltransferase [Xenorhabdus hominickii]AOM41418.1 hypothetical protein A9255_12985 [Xenorhabdus hominickii]PHM55304.1 hypothetical protein Xhom_02038 [Xenorhabdus hominickii]PHM57331.1 hypothetical protein Xhom_00297 [Xenorhabdus hominickii]